MIIDDYLNYHDEYRAKYGENTVILMQVGSFFEMYSIIENDPFMKKISDLTNLILSRKNKSIKEVSRANSLIMGFPCFAYQKFIDILTENNYTCIIIEQTKNGINIDRKITEIISKSTYISNGTNGTPSTKSNYIMVMYFEEMKDGLLIVGIAAADLTTGKSFVFESGATKTDKNLTLDEVYKLLTIYNPTEILILSENEIKNKNQIIEITNSINSIVHQKWNKYELFPIIKKLDYQNKILEKSYQNNSLLSICEFLNLERMNYARVSLCCLLQFAYEHNADIIKELQIPTILEQSKILNIEYNSSLQLNIISNNTNDKPLLDILNRCSTAFGSRQFKERLLNPITDPEELNMRYQKIEELLNNNKFKIINKYLNHINDLERSKRKILLKKFNPSEFTYFFNSLENAIEAFKVIDNSDIIIKINSIVDYLKVLNLDECSKYNIIDIKTNIFNIGYLPEIDKLTENRNDKLKFLNSICESINKIADETVSKLENSDKDGYFILITKKRYETAMNKNKSFMSKFDKKIIGTNNNNLKLTSNEINEASAAIETIETKIQSIVLNEYLSFLTKFLNENKNDLDIIINELTELDINNCNARNSFDYCYHKPTISTTAETSFINAENLRHPIIERIYSEIEYIGNDISLNQNGILLYGINASGKSSFMKAVGLSIIMAQAGMFVPSTNFKYYPYRHIMTRICGSDNIFRGMSSFVVEMTELRNILQRADKSSLIIGDEVCCGTEAISGVAIVSAAINELVSKKASFIFTSHLHELTDISIIKEKIEEDKLKIFHMHIEIIDDLIIYERKLREGQGSNIYGIDVCKSLDMPLDFMKNAEIVKKEIMGLNTTIINTKTSNYNSSIYMDICEVCRKNKANETHHINYQMNADANGRFDNFNKNIQHNLITICDECHKNEHNGNISIIGYKMTNQGKKLEVKSKSKKLIKIENDIWYYRTRSNAKWQPTTENDMISFYNKQMKTTKTAAEILPEFI
jgi:DNA mismatch repair protein MutS